MNWYEPNEETIEAVKNGYCPQWLIIQGRLPTCVLSPGSAALRGALLLPLQQPQPLGWRNGP